MPLVQANGVNLHVQRMGTSGSPVVMVHGLLLGTKSAWFFGVGPALAEEHRVFLYDLRGHGLSERVESGYGLDEMVDDLAAVIEYAGNEPVALVGHSFGGAIALRYASLHPAMVSKLVIVESPIPVISADLDMMLWVKNQQQRAAESRGEDLVLSLSEEQKRQVFGHLPQVLQDALMKNGKRPNLLLAQILDLVGRTTLLDDVLAEPPFTAEELASVECPVLLCYGERSSMQLGPDHMLRTAFKDSKFQVLQGGHALPLDAVAQLAEALKDFLAE
jgi:pimeloyl-ACP methyl ester carboxylesterase